MDEIEPLTKDRDRAWYIRQQDADAFKILRLTEENAKQKETILALTTENENRLQEINKLPANSGGQELETKFFRGSKITQDTKKEE